MFSSEEFHLGFLPSEAVRKGNVPEVGWCSGKIQERNVSKLAMYIRKITRLYDPKRLSFSVLLLSCHFLRGIGQAADFTSKISRHVAMSKLMTLELFTKNMSTAPTSLSCGQRMVSSKTISLNVARTTYERPIGDRYSHIGSISRKMIWWLRWLRWQIEDD